MPAIAALFVVALLGCDAAEDEPGGKPSASCRETPRAPAGKGAQSKREGIPHIPAGGTRDLTTDHLVNAHRRTEGGVRVLVGSLGRPSRKRRRVTPWQNVSCSTRRHPEVRREAADRRARRLRVERAWTAPAPTTARLPRPWHG